MQYPRIVRLGDIRDPLQAGITPDCQTAGDVRRAGSGRAVGTDEFAILMRPAD